MRSSPKSLYARVPSLTWLRGAHLNNPDDEDQAAAEKKTSRPHSAEFKKLYLHTLTCLRENPGIDGPASVSHVFVSERILYNKHNLLVSPLCCFRFESVMCPIIRIEGLVTISSPRWIRHGTSDWRLATPTACPVPPAFGMNGQRRDLSHAFTTTALHIHLLSHTCQEWWGAKGKHLPACTFFFGRWAFDHFELFFTIIIQYQNYTLLS